MSLSAWMLLDQLVTVNLRQVLNPFRKVRFARLLFETSDQQMHAVCEHVFVLLHRCLAHSSIPRPTSACVLRRVLDAHQGDELVRERYSNVH